MMIGRRRTSVGGCGIRGEKLYDIGGVVTTVVALSVVTTTTTVAPGKNKLGSAKKCGGDVPTWSGLVVSRVFIVLSPFRQTTNTMVSITRLRCNICRRLRESCDVATGLC
ncbi:uncharacterized protein LOC108738721 isoform X2 [Agrilus planipennis]|uniref:Uncharacterized protein LOC108738721 isoform X2 n=1 Tax=Agrilus planipennis TaxID=224129 RepID=A0A1W4X5W0_AGRPL|nr:uncharacterized protein LOC108738721 isoform X2 [Agrilus planipennis]